jgi:hypothetical protein
MSQKKSFLNNKFIEKLISTSCAKLITHNQFKKKPIAKSSY